MGVEAGSSVGELAIRVSALSLVGVAVPSSPGISVSATIAVNVAATIVSTSPGDTMVPSLGALAVEMAFTVAIRLIVGMT